MSEVYKEDVAGEKWALKSDSLDLKSYFDHVAAVTLGKLLNLSEPEILSFVKLDYTPNSQLSWALNETVPLTLLLHSNILEYLLAKRCEYTALSTARLPG